MSETATISENPTQALGDVARAAGGVEAPGTERPDPTPSRNERGQFQGKKSDAEVRAILEKEFPDDFKSTPKVQPKAGDLPAEGAKEESKEAGAPRTGSWPRPTHSCPPARRCLLRFCPSSTPMVGRLWQRS